ncbi:hypothetical protein ACWEOZ_20270 [Actinoplanes sp. NPDC004185]
MSAEQEVRLRHLADTHAVIARLSQNSFVIRGWSVTLVTVVVALVTTQRPISTALTLLAVPPALIFWALDAYYVRRERLFRCLYAAIGAGLTGGDDPGPWPFDMATDRYHRAVPGYGRTLAAGHVAVIPTMLLFLAVGLVFVPR